MTAPTECANCADPVAPGQGTATRIGVLCEPCAVTRRTDEPGPDGIRESERHLFTHGAARVAGAPEPGVARPGSTSEWRSIPAPWSVDQVLIDLQSALASMTAQRDQAIEEGRAEHLALVRQCQITGEQRAALERIAEDAGPDTWAYGFARRALGWPT